MSLDREHLLYENLWHDWSGNGRDMRLYGFGDYTQMQDPGIYAIDCTKFEAKSGASIFNQNRYSLGATKIDVEDAVFEAELYPYYADNEYFSTSYFDLKFDLILPENTTLKIEGSLNNDSEKYTIQDVVNSGINNIKVYSLRKIHFTVSGEGTGEIVFNILPSHPNSLSFGYCFGESTVEFVGRSYGNRGYSDVPEDMYDMSGVMIRGWTVETMLHGYRLSFNIKNKTSPTWHGVLAETTRNNNPDESPNVCVNGRLNKIEKFADNGFVYLTSESYNGLPIERGTHVSGSEFRFASWSEGDRHPYDSNRCYFSEFALFNRIVTQEEIQTIKEFWQQLRGEWL